MCKTAICKTEICKARLSFVRLSFVRLLFVRLSSVRLNLVRPTHGHEHFGALTHADRHEFDKVLSISRHLDMLRNSYVRFTKFGALRSIESCSESRIVRGSAHFEAMKRADNHALCQAMFRNSAHPATPSYKA